MIDAARRRVSAGLVALASGALLPGCASQGAPSGGRGGRDGSFSVVTLNIYHDRADWPARLPLIVAGLRALRPDVVALQEVLQDEGLPNQAQSIAEALGHRSHFFSADPPAQARRYGNAILSSRPMSARGGRRLEPLADARTVASARIEIDGRPLDILATHLHHEPGGGELRARQLRGVLAHAASLGGAPKILLGDFNAGMDSTELQPLLAHYVDAYASTRADADAQPANTTLNPAFFDTGRRIDHVLVERDRFEVVDAGIVLDRPGADGTWPSDHFGMHARLRLLS